MSTRSAIIAKTETGYACIYCHFDGYISGVGRTLAEHYKDTAKVQALIQLGDLSSLGERVEPIGSHSFEKQEAGTTVAYGRDRGEEGTECYKAESLDRVIDYWRNDVDGYIYVFDGDKWTVNGKDLELELKALPER